MGVDLKTVPLGVDLVFLVLMEVGLMLGRDHGECVELEWWRGSMDCGGVWGGRLNGGRRRHKRYA